MNSATISADIISYTSLPEKEKRSIEAKIKQFLANLQETYIEQQFYGRLVQGDYIECALNSPVYSLRIALLIKTLIKSINLNTHHTKKQKLKYFFVHGARIAVAVAPLSQLDPKAGIIDGEAIYLSGRTIKKHSTSDKQKIVIKNTLFFLSNDQYLQEQMEAIFYLLDTLLSKCSAKQSEVVFYKLQNLSEKEISKKLNKYQSTISQHSTAAGWNAIEKTINYFEKHIKSWK